MLQDVADGKLQYNKKTGEATKMSLGEFGSNYRYGKCTKD